MQLMKKLVLKLTSTEKSKIEELEEELAKICKENPRCENCPFDENNNGLCIKKQFFSGLKNYLD
jgi:adenine-specific DNA glycosylase